MSARFLLGIDAGTSIIKSTLFDLDGREVAGAALSSSLLAPRPGWAEANMDVVWNAVVATVQHTVAKAHIQPDQLLAIGITGQGDGTWLVNRDYRPVRNAILWSDGRSAPFVVSCQQAGISSELFQITGTALNTCNQGAQLHWLQENEPAALGQTTAILRAKDWVFLCMTGVVSTDETDASHTYFAARRRAYDERVFHLLGIEAWRNAIPPAPPSAKQIGELLPAVAEMMGLRTGTPVVAGPFDVAASALGAGAVDAGDACSVLGTAGVHQIVVDEPVMEPADIGYNMCHAPANRYMRLLPAMTCTPNLQWFVDQAYASELATVKVGGANIWDHLEQLARRVPFGANGVMYHPYLDPAGERAPIFAPYARAQFTGLSAHHTREDMLRAVYEGVALSVLDCYRWLSVPVSMLRLAGGGARSPLWGQMLADAIGCPVEVAEGQEYGARGAVINAGVAIGVYDTYATAVAQTVRPARRYLPAHDLQKRWAILLELYRTTRDVMMPVWEQREHLLQRLNSAD